MPEAHDPLAWLRAAAAEREAAGLGRALHPRQAGPDPLIDLASNDYLGLARHPRVVAGAVAAAQRWGTGATGSRLVTGSTGLHAELENALAGFLGAKSALVFSSGYLANLASVTALAAAFAQAHAPAGPRPTLVVSATENHASLVDACRLARARVEITGHEDLAGVERALARRAEPAALVVTESAFSAGGPLAPLGSLHRLARARDHVGSRDRVTRSRGPGATGGSGPSGSGGIPRDGGVLPRANTETSVGRM